ncbi:MAG: hypothetical protein J7L45_02785 [Candidatus Aenigmarchaeota archaeon]|nr:hypothetical protein [Candidatus Aenigmarchaeota archaeon]
MKIEKKLEKLDKAWEDFVENVSKAINERGWEVSFVPYNKKTWLNPNAIRLKKIVKEKKVGDKIIFNVFELEYKDFKHIVKSGKKVIIDKKGNRKEEKIL